MSISAKRIVGVSVAALLLIVSIGILIPSMTASADLQWIEVNVATITEYENVPQALRVREELPA